MPFPLFPSDEQQEFVIGPIEHVGGTDADVTVKFFKVPPGKKFRIDRVYYNSSTGLAAHASNFLDVSIKKGSTKMCAWSTDADGVGINGAAAEGTLTADTFHELTKSTAAGALVADAGDVLSLVCDESGTTTFPAGRAIVVGRFV